MLDLSAELRSLQEDAALEAARAQALRLERREIFCVRPELLVALYAAVATLIAGVGFLVKANLERIGPVALLAGILFAAALCYGWSSHVRRAGRERSLGEDYLLLLGALLFSAAVGYAEVQFHLFGKAWSRHLLWLALWHLGSAYFFGSRLVLSVALTAFAGWLGVQTRLGSVFDPLYPMLGAGSRALTCALLFWCGSRLHVRERGAGDSGFHEVYSQFAVNFAFWGTLALFAQPATRWYGVPLLLVLVFFVGRMGYAERRESYVLYAVGYGTVGLVWLEALLLGNYVLASWLGLFTVIGAIVLLLRLRARLKDSTA
jgi:hypothetical protein